MTDKQPDALRLADGLEKVIQGLNPTRLEMQIAALLRTQHAAIERKDALLRQALETLYEVPMHTSASTWTPSMTDDLKELCLTINSELSQ